MRYIILMYVVKLEQLLIPFLHTHFWKKVKKESYTQNGSFMNNGRSTSSLVFVANLYFTISATRDGFFFRTWLMVSILH